MLIAFLPKERLLFEADLLDTDQSPAAEPTPDQTSFYNAVRKLRLEVEQIVPVHGEPMEWKEFAVSFAR
jgi:hypothetical protein